MAAIYIHIPFCRKKCNYCNFYSVVSERYTDDFLLSLHKEIELQKDLLKGEKVQTIYFGGGTPSLLSPDSLSEILKKLKETFNLAQNPEITLEANPLDINFNYLQEIKEIGINRLSLGIQSFDNTVLDYLSRTHKAGDSHKAIELVQTVGFENYTMDLIFGVPGMDMDLWKMQLETFKQYGIPHLSAYALTVEEKTPLDLFIKKGRVESPKEESAAEHLEYLMLWASENDFEHYEISNLSKKGFRSKHNSSYWNREKYLGLGPSAHSYNGNNRYWNVANVKKYIEQIGAGIIPSESESLTEIDIYNELILTRIRTVEGVNIDLIEKKYKPHFLNQIQKHIQNRNVKKENEFYKLTPQGILLSDAISMDLFYDKSL